MTPMASVLSTWRTTSGASAILYALDNVRAEGQAAHGHALANLALLTGNLGKPSTGLYVLPRGANGQGAMDVGCVPDMLPGYQRVDHEPHRFNIGPFPFVWQWGIIVRTMLAEKPPTSALISNQSTGDFSTYT